MGLPRPQHTPEPSVCAFPPPGSIMLDAEVLPPIYVVRWFKQLGLTKVYPAYDEYKTCEHQGAEIQGLPSRNRTSP